MQNFLFRTCLKLKKNHYLKVKTAKKIFDDFSVVNACVSQY